MKYNENKGQGSLKKERGEEKGKGGYLEKEAQEEM
jgi:hypothetical protein